MSGSLTNDYDLHFPSYDYRLELAVGMTLDGRPSREYTKTGALFGAEFNFSSHSTDADYWVVSLGMHNYQIVSSAMLALDTTK